MSPTIRLERLDHHDSAVDPENCMNGLSYRSVLGSVLYISTSTRPDIAFAVNNVARHVTGLGPPHVRALLRIVKYLNGTQSWGVRYQPVSQSSHLSYANPRLPGGHTPL